MYPNLLRLLLYAIGIPIFFLATSTKLSACSSSFEPERGYVTYFNPEIAGDSTFQVCYMDADLIYDFSEQSPAVERYEQNLAEWQKYAGGNMPLSDIAEIIYGTSAKALQEQVLMPMMSNGKITGKLRKNLFLQQLFKAQDINAVRYIIFSKQCEPHIAEVNHWDDVPERDIEAMSELIETAKLHYAETNAEFLRLRYGFQAARLAHYAKQHEKAIALYDELVAPVVAKSSSLLVKQGVALHWAIAIKAGALLRIGKRSESLYWFSKAFAADPKNRGRILRDFASPVSNDFNAALALTQSPAEKATLLLLYATGKDELNFDELKQLYAIAPESEEVGILLMREVAKIEQQLLSPYLFQRIDDDSSLEQPETDPEIDTTNVLDIDLDSEGGSLPSFVRPANHASIWESITGFFSGIWEALMGLFGNKDEEVVFDGTAGYKNQMENKAYIAQLADFVAAAITNPKIKSPALWQTAAAYLYFLADQHNKAQELANGVKSTDKNIMQQAYLVSGLSLIAQGGKVTPDAEDAFYKALDGKQLPENEYQLNNICSYALVALAQKYLLNNDLPHAVLCFEKAKEETTVNILLDTYSTYEQLDALLELLNKDNKTRMEKWLSKQGRLNPDVVYDIQGTKLLREGKKTEALQKFERISPDYWKENAQQANDFGGISYSTFFTNFDKDLLGRTDEEGMPFNKLTFTRKVVSLEEIAQKDPTKAQQAYYQVANGFVGTPFWGYNDPLWRGMLIYTIGYYNYDDYPLNLPKIAAKLGKGQDEFRQNYGKRNLAQEYYVKSAEVGKNAELSARAIYMAKICQSEPFASFHEGNSGDPKYAKILAEKYGDTEFYQQIIQECLGLEDFMK